MRLWKANAIAMLLAVPATAAPVNTANPFNAKLMALKLADRQGALSRAIVDDGQRCGRLTKSAYRGPYGNLGMWVATCKPGGDFAVFTGPDGSVQVRPCGNLAALKLPACGKIE